MANEKVGKISKTARAAGLLKSKEQRRVCPDGHPITLVRIGGLMARVCPCVTVGGVPYQEVKR